MRLIVGLGNPGKQYQNSKHNVGFMALDSYAEAKKIKYKKSIKFTSELIKLDGAILLKPKTFMNRSGIAVRKVCEYYKIDPSEVLVIHDDLNLPFLKLRLRPSGGAGGHNGIKSIMTWLDTEEFKRLRVGIGRDTNKEMKDDVLSDFSKSDLKQLTEIQSTIASIIDDFIRLDEFDSIMNIYNGNI